MKRRKFFSKAMAGSAVALTTGPFSTPEASEAPQYRSIHNSGLMETIISIPDLPKKLTILHVSDSHISCDDESDSPLRSIVNA